MNKRVKRLSLLLAVLMVAATLFILTSCNNSNATIKPTATISPTETALPPTLAPTTVPTQEPTLAPTPTPVDIVSNNPKTVNFFPSSSTQLAQQLSYSLAIQFHATAPLNGLEITCPSWGDSNGTLVFDLYAWAGDFDSTLEKWPVATQEFVNYSDNANNKMTFDELPAGEYLLYITSPDPNQGVGIWTIETEDYEYVALYIEDVYFSNFVPNHFRVFYTKTPAVLHGNITVEE